MNYDNQFFQLFLGGFVTFLGSILKPLNCFSLILRDALSLKDQIAKTHHRECHALFRCEAIIVDRLCVILRHTFAGLITVAQIVQADRVTFRRTFFEEFYGLRVILRHSLAMKIAMAQIALGRCKTFFRSEAISFGRFFIAFGHALAFGILQSKVIHAFDASLFSGLPI